MLSQDEPSVDANNDGRNFLSDNISVFCCSNSDRSSPRKWNHVALLPVLTSLETYKRKIHKA